MSTGPGLRERKKEQTRQAIRQAAVRLFAEHGFDAVAVAQVADEANVSTATVYNYFPTKEDLVFAGMEVFEAELIAAIRGREPGESVLAAFRRFVLEIRGLLASKRPEDAQRLATVSRIVTASPALRAREREITAQYTQALAALIADETGRLPTTSPLGSPPTLSWACTGPWSITSAGGCWPAHLTHASPARSARVRSVRSN